MSTDTNKISTRMRLDNAIKELDDIRNGDVEYTQPAAPYYITAERVYYLKNSVPGETLKACSKCAFVNGTRGCVEAPCCDDGYFKELGV
jgi:hypothetical protein